MLRMLMMAIVAATLSPSNAGVAAESGAEQPMVHIAEIEIDPQLLDAYKTLLAEEQEASVRLEPGVLMLHSVSLTEAPAHIRLLEVYASRIAYEAHLRSPHFLRYKTLTEKMVLALKLIETTPIRLCAKSSRDATSSGSCM